MIPADIQKKVKLLEIRTRRLVNNIFAGEYQTKFRGQGMTFSDFREYVPGDDVRTISWTLTARAGKPYVKQFEEEREMTMVLAVDVSGSLDFGTGLQFKGEACLWLSALLAFAASKNNDRVGLLLFSDRVEHYVPPQKGRGHVQRLLRDLYYIKPKSSKTNLSAAFEHLASVLKKRATIFVFSDFMDQQFDKTMRSLGSKHEVVACQIQDSAEKKIFDVGLVDVYDAETGETQLIDTSDKSVNKAFEQINLAVHEKRKKQIRASRVEHLLIQTEKDITLPLIQYFQRRKG